MFEAPVHLCLGVRRLGIARLCVSGVVVGLRWGCIGESLVVIGVYLGASALTVVPLLFTSVGFGGCSLSSPRAAGLLGWCCVGVTGGAGDLRVWCSARGRGVGW